MFKKQILIFLLCLTAKLGAYEPQPHVPAHSFALFTVPKSGSHLLIKALYFMTGFTPFWHVNPPSLQNLYEENHFPYTHCCLPPLLFQYYAYSPVKQILGIRDLRDVCVSIVSQILKGNWPEFTGDTKKIRNFTKLTFDEQLLYVINQEYEAGVPHAGLQLGIRKVAEQAVVLAKDPNILVCRYEDLVGPEGGGSVEAQKETLQKIANHIGIPISSSEIDEMAPLLYGNQENPFGEGDFKKYQSTFRNGRIGSWKKTFKPIHKEAFKRRVGAALVALGYEKDDNW